MIQDSMRKGFWIRNTSILEDVYFINMFLRGARYRERVGECSSS